MVQAKRPQICPSPFGDPKMGQATQTWPMTGKPEKLGDCSETLEERPLPLLVLEGESSQAI